MIKVRILKGQVMSKNNVIEKWRRIIGEGKLPPDSPQELVAAIQDMGVDADTAVLDPLIKQLSDHAMKFLRSRVGTNHPNRGEDIVLRAHNSLIVALCNPQSSDGQGFRVAYYKRLSFRLKDAIAKETRERRTEDDIVVLKAKNENHRDLAEAKTTLEDDPQINEDEEDLEDEHSVLEAARPIEAKAEDSDGDAVGPGKVNYHPDPFEGVDELLEQLDVDRLLEECIPNERKRLAFRLYIDGLPAKSIGPNSIAKVLGIDESTARAWINEARDILGAKVGERK
jgi:DNA-directed RNA polymerase specialized sigma24 family protein